MTRFYPRSFCQLSEKLYKTPFCSKPHGKTPKGVISKHNHVHPKFYLIFSRNDSISVRLKNGKMFSEILCNKNYKFAETVEQAETNLVQKSGNSINGCVFQLLALAVGH